MSRESLIKELKRHREWQETQRRKEYEAAEEHGPATELQPGDVVRIIGQDLHWTVLFLEYPIVHVDALSGITRGDTPDGARLWNDVHGVHTFGLDVLERVS